MSKNLDNVQYVWPNAPLRRAIQRWVDINYPNHHIVFTPVFHNNLVMVSIVPVSGRHQAIHIPFKELKPYLPSGATASPPDWVG
ncbi:hypothetical protein ES708_33598 [subsurface metagenome]